MMRAIVFLLGVILGAVVAVATTQFLAPQPTTAPIGAPSADSVEKVGRAFEDAMARALRRVQSEASAAMSSKSSPGDSGAAAPGDAASKRRRSADPPPDSPNARDADSPGTMTRDPSKPLHEKNVARLGQLVVRTKAAEAKRRQDWLLLSEAAVHGELGVPDRISPNDDGSENWVYDVPFTNADGDTQSGTLVLTVLRGRVIDVSGADDIRE
jgi:hypothetical protein